MCSMSLIGRLSKRPETQKYFNMNRISILIQQGFIIFLKMLPIVYNC
jgi:hypothetical protein